MSVKFELKEGQVWQCPLTGQEIEIEELFLGEEGPDRNPSLPLATVSYSTRPDWTVTQTQKQIMEVLEQGNYEQLIEADALTIADGQIWIESNQGVWIEVVGTYDDTVDVIMSETPEDIDTLSILDLTEILKANRYTLQTSITQTRINQALALADWQYKAGSLLGDLEAITIERLRVLNELEKTTNEAEAGDLLQALIALKLKAANRLAMIEQGQVWEREAEAGKVDIIQITGLGVWMTTGGDTINVFQDGLWERLTEMGYRLKH